jgi:hypothetical protein
MGHREGRASGQGGQATSVRSPEVLAAPGPAADSPSAPSSSIAPAYRDRERGRARGRSPAQSGRPETAKYASLRFRPFSQKNLMDSRDPARRVVGDDQPRVLETSSMVESATARPSHNGSCDFETVSSDSRSCRLRLKTTSRDCVDRTAKAEVWLIRVPEWPLLLEPNLPN